MKVLMGIIIPFAGTFAGAAFVFFMKKELSQTAKRIMAGFASGVMTAASVWSLIIPAIDQSESLGGLAFLPAAIGFWIGILFLMLMESATVRLDAKAGNGRRMSPVTMMVFAVTLHNIPEGMAVGVAYAGALSGQANAAMLGALALAVGIAIQNIPEGAIISMPLRAKGKSRASAFLGGVLSGAVEPPFALLAVLLAGRTAALMPYFLSFAAGAMVYVVIKELIPEMNDGERSNLAAVMFTFGFTLMMALDVALG